MKHFLHNSILFVLLLTFSTVAAHHGNDHHHSSECHHHSSDSHNVKLDNLDNDNLKKVFSYNKNVFLKHNEQSLQLVKLDFFTSGDNFDFNCSGGFCMNKSHFHKKGISVKKQLFVYFMKMSC